MQNNNRLSWIDAIRGIGAVMVVIFHLWQVYRIDYAGHNTSLVYKALDHLIFTSFDFGKIGVVLFFMVSGFVIPISLIRHKNYNIRKFVISRVFRLYPVYWFSIILALIFIGGFGIKQVIANITMFQGFLFIKDMIGVYWTLQIELSFYIYCIFLFLIKKLDSTSSIAFNVYIWTIISFIFGVVRHYTHSSVPTALPLGLSVMFLGMIYRFYLFKEKEVNVKSLISCFTFFLIFIIPTSYLSYGEEWIKYTLTYFIGLLGFLLISKFRGYSFEFTSFVGKVSYSLYLLHPIVSFWIFKTIMNLGIKRLEFVIPILLLSIIAGIGVSWITYNLIEKQFVLLGRRLTKKLAFDKKAKIIVEEKSIVQ